MPLKPETWFISLSDFLAAIQKAKLKIALFSLCVGGCLFLKQLASPLTFKGEAVFKRTVQTPSSAFSTILKAVSDNSPPIVDDATAMMGSLEVMKQVVKKLDLQGYLNTQPSPGLLKRVWHNLYLEGSYHHFRTAGRPSSSILDPSIAVADAPLFVDQKPFLTCSKINYNAPFYTTLTLKLVDQNTVEISRRQKLLGVAKLGHVFEWEHGSFVLMANEKPPQNKEIKLTLIPLEAAGLSLQKQITIKPDKEKPSLLLLKFTHTDPHLATSVVNELMLAYHTFLHTLGKQKIDKQLLYLHHRKEELHQETEKVATLYKDFLKKHIGKSEFTTTEAEVAYISEKQNSCQTLLNTLMEEMQKLCANGQAPLQEAPFETVLEKARLLKEEHVAQTQFLTLEIVKTQLAAKKQELAAVLEELKNCTHCLQKLEDPSVESESLSQLVKNPSIAAQFAKIQTLSFNLQDKNKWTQLEKEHFKERLEIEKNNLKLQLQELVKSSRLEKAALQGKIEEHEKTTLCLLYESYCQTQDHLQHLKEQLEKLPEKWLLEQKIEFEKNYQSQMLKACTQMVEEKNMSLYLQNIDSQPLQMASPALLPCHPRLLLRLVGGALVGACLFLFALFLKIAFRFPSASAPNLKEVGLTVLGTYSPPFTLQENHALLAAFSFHVRATRGVTLITSKTELPLHVPFLDEQLLWITFKESADFSAPLNLDTVEKKEGYDTLCLKTATLLDKEKMALFFATLEKQYQWVFVQNCFSPTCVQLQTLLDLSKQHVVVTAPTDTLAFFTSFAPSTLFIVERPPSTQELSRAWNFWKKKKQQTLKELKPLLAAFLSEFKKVPFVKKKL